MFKRKCCNPKTINFFNSQGYFEDITFRRTQFFKKVHSGNGALLKQGLNSEPFPNVRCPLGCLDFVDSNFKCIPFQHYFNSINANFKHFNADSSKLSGVRPDWLEEHNILKWQIKPATIMSPEFGLSIVVCRNHVGPENKFVHVPQSPILMQQKIWDPHPSDPVALCAASTQVLRKTRAGKNSTSFAVLKQRGHSSGVNSVSFAPKLSLDAMNFNEQTVASIVLSAKERPDVAASIRKRPNGLVHPDMLESYLQQDNIDTKRAGPPEYGFATDNEIKKATASGTYVPLCDAVNLARIQNVETNTETRSKQMKKYPIEVLSVDSTPSAKASLLKTANYPKTNGFAAFNMFRSIVLHSHHLLVDIIYLSCLDEPNTLLVDFVSILSQSQIKSPTITPKVKELAEKFFHTVNNLRSDVDEDSVEERVAKMFDILGLNLKVFSSSDNAINFRSENNDFIISTQNGTEGLERDGDYTMMIAASTDTGVGEHISEHIAFRSTSKSDFHAIRGEDVSVVPHDEINRQNLFLYVKKSKLNGFKEDEALNFYGGQRIMKCSAHTDEFLIKTVPDDDYHCSKNGCKCKARWKCDVRECTTALCKKHATEVMKTGTITEIIQEQANPISASSRREADEDEPEEEIYLEAVQVENDAIFDLFESNNENQIPLTSDPMERPATESAHPGKVSCHYLLNKTLGAKYTTMKLKSVPRRYEQLLHQIYSNYFGNSEPLLYPEAQIKTNIFFKDEEGSIVGALPSVCFGKYGEKLKQPGGLASLDDHIQIRLRDLIGPIARDTQMIAFYADCRLNRGLTENSAVKVLKRGFEFCTKLGVSSTDDGNRDRFGNDWEIQKLSYQMKDLGTWDYFFTLTCNTSRTPGVGPIHRAIEEEYLLNSEKRKKMFENLVTVFARCWERTVRYLVHYLCNSDERIMGKIFHIWLRYEFQSAGSLGNLPHVHGGVTLEKGEDPHVTHKRVSCVLNSFNMLKGWTRDDLVGKGKMFETEEEYVQVRKTLQETMVHDCKNANERCKKKTVNGKPVCRVRGMPYTLQWEEPKDIHNIFSKEANEILAKLNLAVVEGNNVKLLHEKLIGKNYTYPNNSTKKGIPTIAPLGYLLESSTNVQVCDCRFCTAYVLKYAAGTDEKRDVNLFIKEDDKEVSKEVRELYNAKIKSAAFAEHVRRQEFDIKTPLFKEVPLTDIVWYILNLPYVYTNVTYETVSTKPYSARSGLMSYGVNKKSQINENNTIKSIQSRIELTTERRFTEHQCLHIENCINGNYVCDEVTRFSIRPPEYLSVDKLKNYVRWFEWKCSDCSKKKCNKILEKVDESSINDGLNKNIKIRERYLPEVSKHFALLKGRSTSQLILEMSNLCSTLEKQLRQNKRDDFYDRYVCHHDLRPVVVVYDTNSPNDRDAFVLSHVIRVGNFECEYNLFEDGDILRAYERAKLISDKNNVTEEEVNVILRDYVLEELVYLPLSKNKFARHLNLAKEAFENLLLKKSFTSGNPLCLDSMLQAACNQQLEDYEKVCEERCIEKISAEISLPENLNCFTPNLQIMPGQTQESYNEKTKALELCVNTLNQLNDPLIREPPKSPWLIGAPGSGKSYLMFTVCAYAICLGLKTCLMSYTAQRSQAIGGSHLHSVFMLPVVKNHIQTVQMCVAKALESLHRAPLKLAYLKRVQVFFFDEIGLISLEQLAVIDKILRIIKERECPFGGALFVACGDHHQLAPIEGTFIWESFHIFTCIKVLLLNHLVRSQEDTDLQKIITELRESSITRFKIDSVVDILTRRCKDNSVSSLEHVPRHYMVVVGKKQARNEINANRLETLHNEGIACFVAKAKDEVRHANSDNWTDASEENSKKISKYFDEEHQLLIFKGTIMQLTVNNLKGKTKYTQGQLVLIEELPDLNDDPTKQFVQARLLPPGVRTVSVDIPDPTWPSITLRKSVGREILLGKSGSKLYARRIQFDLRYYTCTTVHRIIGDTCIQLATKISSVDQSYSLWERAQLTVIISRVKNLNQLMFIGSWDETCKEIKKVLRKTSRQLATINQRLIKLNALNDIPAVINVFNDLKPIKSCIPADSSGFVFLCFSVQDPENFDVRVVEDIRNELTSMNSSSSLKVHESLRPYLPGFYVTGFIEDQFSIHNLKERCRYKDAFRRGRNTIIVNLNRFKFMDALALGRYISLKCRFASKLTHVQTIAVPEDIQKEIFELLDDCEDWLPM